MAQREVHYHCSSCGAPQSDVKRGLCDYCSAPRVPIGTPDPSRAIRCSDCHRLVADGASFCPKCGNATADFDTSTTDFACPHCGDAAHHMTRWGIAPTAAKRSGHEIDGCTHCGGVWIQASTLDAMIDEAAQLARDGVVEEKVVKRRLVTEIGTKVEYRRCPICNDLMARQNFQRVSGIILDSCPRHGTFFDAGELEDTLDFVRSGGLVLAQRRRKADDERLSRAEAAAKLPVHQAGMLGHDANAGAFAGLDARHPLESSVGTLTLAFLRWSAGWTLKFGRRLWRGMKS